VTENIKIRVTGIRKEYVDWIHLVWSSDSRERSKEPLGSVRREN
jgi:hypothetical protein